MYSVDVMSPLEYSLWFYIQCWPPSITSPFSLLRLRLSLALTLLALIIEELIPADDVVVVDLEERGGANLAPAQVAVRHLGLRLNLDDVRRVALAVLARSAIATSVEPRHVAAPVPPQRHGEHVSPIERLAHALPAAETEVALDVLVVLGEGIVFDSLAPNVIDLQGT